MPARWALSRHREQWEVKRRFVGRSLCHGREPVERRLAKQLALTVVDAAVLLNFDAGALLQSAQEHAARRESEAQRDGEVLFDKIPKIIHGPFAAR